MRFIGITGGVGAGKTEILKYIGQHYKCEIYLADDIGHKVKEPGTEGYQALVELLGRASMQLYQKVAVQEEFLRCNLLAVSLDKRVAASCRAVTTPERLKEIP